MERQSQSIETKSVHAGMPAVRSEGAAVMPIYQSSTYDYDEGVGYHDVRYIRLNNNPNQQALGVKLAAMEEADAALVTASGMAAISTTLLTVLGAGDHLLAMNCLYGGTAGLVAQDLPAFGITHTLIDGQDYTSWEKLITPATKAIYVETLTNPLMEVPDLEAVVEFARANGLVSIIDNTFASPINYLPIANGFDLVIESATKYLNGHNDIVAGVVAGRGEMIRSIKRRLDHLGGSLDPHACFLLDRGLKTLSVRVAYQNESAAAVARFLDQHDAVSRVNHPSLADHAQHERAARLFAGFGGMISFEVEGGVEAAEAMFRRCTLAIIAPSLGGPETLMVRPAAAVHSGLSKEERESSGISDSLIRLSVGLEGTQDLIADFDQAMTAAGVTVR